MRNWRHRDWNAESKQGIKPLVTLPATLPSTILDWFAAREWTPRRHQLEMLDAAREGRHALLVAATGAGKTLAGFLPSLSDLITDPADGLHTLYISPLKALVVDVRRNLLMPIEEMGLPIRAEARTGDTPSDRKARQRVKPPHILLTTPESLSLLLSHEDSVHMFSTLKRCPFSTYVPVAAGPLTSASM